MLPMATARLGGHGPRLFERLATRVVLFVALPLALLLIVVILINARSNFANRRSAAERELRSLVLNNAQLIEDQNNNAAQSARVLADLPSEGVSGDRLAVLRIMERMVLAEPSFNGMFCVYEPDSDGRDAESLETVRSAALTDTGRLVPYIYRTMPGGNALQLESGPSELSVHTPRAAMVRHLALQLE